MIHHQFKKNAKNKSEKNHTKLKREKKKIIFNASKLVFNTSKPVSNASKPFFFFFDTSTQGKGEGRIERVTSASLQL